MTKSKISCLPSTLQDELNERLNRNEDDPAAPASLNVLPPAVQTILAERFRSQLFNHWKKIPRPKADGLI